MRELGIERNEGVAGAVDDYDVAIVGGGAAGLSAALVLGRALRKVIVIDGGAPRNAPASHMHGFLGHDGLPPLMLIEKGRAEIASYGVTIVDEAVVSAASYETRDTSAFVLTLADGRQVTSRRLLLAGGARDVLPDIPRLKEVWGEDVHICPYCHGYEVRNQPLAVIASGDHAVPYTLLIRNWSSDLLVFEHEHGPFSEDGLEQLEALGIRTVPGKIRRLVTDSGRLQTIEMESGELFPRAAIFMPSYLIANTTLLETLGAEISQTPQGPMASVDPQGRTSVPGVWATGNVTNAAIQVVGAAAAGNLAGGSINMDLIQEDIRHRVSARRLDNQHVPGGTSSSADGR